MTTYFNEGDLVFLCRGEWQRLERRVKRRYKNGNFTLEGDEHNQQWKPYGDYAKETGKDYYSSAVVYAKTDDRLKFFGRNDARRDRARRWNTALEFVQKQQGRLASEEQVVMLECLVELIKLEHAENARISSLKCTDGELCCMKRACQCDNCQAYRAHYDKK